MPKENLVTRVSVEVLKFPPHSTKPSDITVYKLTELGQELYRTGVKLEDMEHIKHYRRSVITYGQSRSTDG